MSKKAIFLTVFLCLVVNSAPFSDNQAAYATNRALEGLTTSQVYFDVNLGDANKLALRMDLIDRTLKQMQEAGVAVTAVIGFRGSASRFVTKNSHYVLEEELVSKRIIQDKIRSFIDRGIPVEQCQIAAKLYSISSEDFLGEITLVKNGYVSLIGYQNNGYAVIPMD